MIALPELKRLTIQSLNFELQIQLISLRPQKSINSLVFEHRAASETFGDVIIEALSNSLYGLVYELPSISQAHNTFEELESLLNPLNTEYGVGILHEPTSNYSNLYLMIHKNDSTILSSAVKSARIAIFKLSYKQVFENCPEKFIRYIIQLNRSNEAIFGINNQVKLQQLQITVETQRKAEEVLELTEKNGKTNKGIVTARNLIRKLAEDTNAINGEHVLDCVNCKLDKRNIMFLPCGHCVQCKMCTMFTQKMPLNVKIKKSRFKCSACKKSIDEAIEVFFN